MRPAITVGLGLNTPKGRRVFLTSDPVESIRREISRHQGAEAWCSPHTWKRDHRKKERWEASIGVFVDIDSAQHGVLATDAGASAIEAIRDITNLAYQTPHGVRAILVFSERVSDPGLFERAALGAAAEVEKAFVSAGVVGLDVDFPATKDRARAFFTSKAIVKCRHEHPECVDPHRRADVQLLRAEPWSAEELAAGVPKQKERESTKRSKGSSARSVSCPTDLAAALLGAEGVERGGEVTFRCPLPGHIDEHPSARFNTDKGAWYCDVCGEGGGWKDLARRRGVKVSTKPRKGSGPVVPRNSPPGDRWRKIIYRFDGMDVPLHRLAPPAIDALVEHCSKTLYVRGNRLARVCREPLPPLKSVRRGGGLRISAVPDGILRELLDSAASWIVVKQRDGGQGDEDETWAPLPVVSTIRDRGEWPGMLPLLGIVEAPTLRPDGSVLDQVGYDMATGLLYQPCREFPGIPERPTETEVIAATGTLLDPFRGFRFEGEADSASLAALLFTIAARSAIDGPVPHWAVMAPTFGAGKTLLCEAATLAMTGVDPDLMSPVGGRMADAESEMRKRLTTLILEAPRVAIIDNVPDGASFESKAFAALLTMTVWTDRLLGKNEKVRLPHMIVWMTTGCNYRLWGDIARRSLSIVIDPGVEDPHHRTFEIEDLLEYVRDRHPELLVAALTILRGFVVAGQPRHSRPPLGKFESWDRLIRGAVIWATDLAGAAIDPLDTAARLKDEAPDRTGQAELLAAWSAAFPGGEPVTARQVIAQAQDDSRLLEAILGVGGARKGVPDSRALGNRLRVLVGRVLNGLVLRKAGKLQGSALWRVVSADVGGTRGSSGSGAASTDLPPARAGAPQVPTLQCRSMTSSSRARGRACEI